jgi:hypothetical protein
MTETPKELLDPKVAGRIKVMEASARIQMARITLFVILSLNVVGVGALLWAIFVDKAIETRTLVGGFEAFVLMGFRYVLKNLFPTSSGKKWWEVVFGPRR